MKSLVSLFIVLSFNLSNAKVEYKTNRIKKEFSQLRIKNNYLYKIIHHTASDFNVFFNKNLVITEVYRTEREQKRYYKGKRVFKSSHQDWSAVDIRTRDLREVEINFIIKKIREVYFVKNGFKTTVLYHDVGLGKHIHVQFRDYNEKK